MEKNRKANFKKVCGTCKNWGNYTNERYRFFSAGVWEEGYVFKGNLCRVRDKETKSLDWCGSFVMDDTLTKKISSGWCSEECANTFRK